MIFLLSFFISVVIIYFDEASGMIPSSLQVGVMGPLFTGTGAVNIPGVHSLAAIYMAIKEINNKTDHVADSLLPNTTIKFALRTPRQNYIEAISASLDLYQSVFGGTGVLAVIGTSATSSSQASAEVFASTPKFTIPQISYGAIDASLGDKSVYSYFSRSCPSETTDGRVIANFIHHYFSWNTVTVLSSSDIYGSKTLLSFQDEAYQLGINIESRYVFWTGQPDFSDILNSIKSSSGIKKIFVFLMKSNDAGNLLEQGYDQGIFISGTQIIGTQYIATTDTWAKMTPSKVRYIMKGVIGVSPIIQEARSSLKFQKFVSRYRSQTASKRTTAQGTILCSKATDNDGTNLYQAYPTAASKTMACAGFDFSTIATDGSNMEDMALYAYDATYALAYALHNLIYDQNISSFTGSQLYRTIVDNVSFTGVSGHIDFSEGGTGTEAYGKGDRVDGLEYEIQNFNPITYHADVDSGALGWSRVGYWVLDSSTFVPCAFDDDALCSQWVFNTPQNQLPVDAAPVVEVDLSDAVRLLLRVGGGITIAFACVILIIVIIYHQRKIFQAAQPDMLIIALIGVILTGARILITANDITTELCIASKWCGHLAFGLVFGAMILKTWRLDSVVNASFTSNNIRRKRLTKLDLQKYFGIGILLLCFYLAFDTGVAQPHATYDAIYDGHTIQRLMKCENEIPEITYILFGFEGCLLFWGARLCWITKHAPGVYNDSKYIALSKFYYYYF